MGIGLGASVVGGFADAHKSAIASCFASADPYQDLEPSSQAETQSYGATEVPGVGRPRMASRKYSECVPSSYVASSMARSMSKSMSVARPTGFLTAGLGSVRNTRGENEPLIA